MIFKTFDSKIDKWTSKIGIFEKSFNDIFEAKNQKKLDIDDLVTYKGMSLDEAKKQVGSFWNYLYPKKEDIQKQLIDVDNLLPKIDENKATSILEYIKSIEDGVNSEIGSFQELYDTGNKQNQWLAQYAQETQGQIRSTEGVIKANQQARASALAHNEAIKAQTFSAKAGKVALQALAMAGNMIAMWGISKVVQGIVDLATATDRFADSASDIGSTLSNTTSDLSSYKKETKELWETINDQSSSIEDTTSARQRLMEIQDELLEKYGDEKDAVKLVTDAVKENTTAFDDFSFSQYQEAMNDFIADNSGFWDKLAYGLNGNGSVKESMISTMANYIAGAGNGHLFENLRKQIGADLFDQILDANDVQQIAGAITGNIDDVTTAVYQLQDALAMNKSTMDDSTFEKLNQGLALQATQASELADKYSDLYDQYILYEKILSDSDENGYAESLNKITEAYKKYQEVAATGNADQIQESFNEYATTLQDSLNSTLTDSKNGEVVARYFRNMFPTLQEEFSKWQFKIDFDVENGGIKEEIEAYAKEFSNSNEIINFDTRMEHTDDQIAAYNALIDLAGKYHMEIEQLVFLMEEFGLIASHEKENLIATLSGDEQNLIVEDWVNTLTEEEMKLANSTAFDEALDRQKEELDGAALSAENYTTALEEVKAQQNEISDNEIAVLSFDEAWANSFTSEDDKVRELGDSLLGLAEKGRLTKEIFNEADSTVGGYFKNLGISADEAVSKINKLVDESSQLSSMASQISSMAEALSTKLENGFVSADTLSGFDVEVRGLESWDRFQEVLGSTTSSYEECQEAANALATEWVNSSDFLAQLTEQNEEYYKTQLEAMGVENYEEVITYAHALNEAKEVLSQSSLELGNATYDEIEALIAEGQYSELAANMILALYNAKIAEQAATIDTAADCANLIALAGDADRTSQSIQLLIQLMNIYSGLEDGVYSKNEFTRTAALGAVTAIKAQLEAIANGETKQMEIEPTVKLGSKGKSSAKSAGKDAGKSYKDGLKEELSDLDSVISGITGKIDKQISVIKSQKEAALESIDAQIDALNEQKSALEAQKKALEEARDAAVEALEEERDARIEVIEQQQKQLEQQIKLIDKQIKDKEKVIKSINDEIDAMKDANEERQRQIDLQKAQYELERLQHQRTILLYSEEKGLHYVNDSKNIRDQKQKVDDAKLEIEIANKQKQIDLIEKEIDLLNEKKDAINEQIDLLDEEIERINEYYDKEIEKVKEFYDEQIKAIDAQIESIDKQIEALEKQREQTEKYYESLIENLEKSKSKYEELKEIVEEAELSAKLKQLGIDEEALLNGSEEEFEKLKNIYMGIVAQLNEGNDAFLSKLQELSGYDGTAPTLLSDSNTELDTMNGNLDTANQNVGSVNTSLGETATTTSDVASNVSDLTTNLGAVNTIVTEEQTAFEALKQTINEVVEVINLKIQAIQEEQNAVGIATSSEMADFLLLKEKILEVKESLDLISDTVMTLDTTPVNNLTTAFQLLYDQLVLVAATLGAGMEGAEDGAVSGIASAIQALNEISLEEGIIAQFTNLKTAIDEVTAAIGGGGSGDSEGEGSGGGSGSKSKGGGGESGGKGSESGGGGNSLTGAIEQMGETAAEVIGEPDAEGDGTVIGEFGAMETAVNDVTAAIGSADSEEGSGGEGEDSGTLIGSIVDLGETTQEEMGESGGDGIIGRFEEFRDVIADADAHVSSISDGLDEIDGKDVECTITVNIKVNGSLPAFASGTALGTMNLNSAEYNAKYSGSAHVEGTALASGNWAVQSNEQSALLGEVGYEIIVRNGRFFTVGDNGPEMFPIKKGDIVFNHQQSVELLKNGHTSGRGKAYADGTVGGGKVLTSDGRIIYPVAPGDSAWELEQKANAYLEKIADNSDVITNSGLFRYETQMGEILKSVTNVNNVTNNKNVQQPITIEIGDINLTGVQDVNGLAQAIKTRLPNAMLQEIHRR